VHACVHACMCIYALCVWIICACIYIYMYTHKHTHTHIYIYIYIHAHTRVKSLAKYLVISISNCGFQGQPFCWHTHTLQTFKDGVKSKYVHTMFDITGRGCNTSRSIGTSLHDFIVTDFCLQSLLLCVHVRNYTCDLLHGERNKKLNI
jgi:hypothetical protein